MLTSHALLVPHLPTLLLDEHRQHRTGMLQALESASEALHGEAPAAAVVLSARWLSDAAFLVGDAREHRTVTDYSGLGVEVRHDCAGQPALARALVAAGQKAGLRVAAARRGIDSGVTVPMHFLFPRRDLAVVPLSLAAEGAADGRAWGRTLRATLAAWPERVVFVVGGLLSFDDRAWTMRRDVPDSEELDRQLLEAMRTGDWSALPPRFLGKAQPEAGRRHLEVLRGFVGDGVPGDVRCYESAPGVGAALVTFPVGEAVPAPAARQDLAPPAG